nr:conopeptide [Conus lividus]
MSKLGVVLLVFLVLLALTSPLQNGNRFAGNQARKVGVQHRKNRLASALRRSSCGYLGQHCCIIPKHAYCYGYLECNNRAVCVR